MTHASGSAVARKPQVKVAMMALVLAMMSGCRTFSHYVYIGGATWPELDGTWYGQVVPVTLYDGMGRPFPVPAAALHIEGGHVDYVQNSGMPALELAPGRATAVLSKDGEHALPFSDFAPDSWIEVTGTIYPNYDLKAPGSNIWVDEIPRSKNISGGKTVSVRFLQIHGAARSIPPRP